MHRRDVLGDDAQTTGQGGAAHRFRRFVGAGAAMQCPGPSCWRLRHLTGAGASVLVASAAVFFGDEDQRDLAAVVDVGDLHTQLVADLDHVLDLGDALAPAQLGDVHQAVTTRQQRHERAEIGCLDHGSEESLTDLGQLRVGDRVDLVDRGLCGLAVGGADEHRAVVLDGDLRAGLLGDRVDHLALGPDDLADLVDRHLDRGDPRRVRAHLVGRVDGLGHHLEDGQPGVLGLRQRARQHLRRDAVELGVELQRGDEVLGARDLEVHIAERVLGAEDVGQRDEATLGSAAFDLDVVGHQTHRDARDRRLQRHTGVQQRQRRRAHRAHRGRTVGAQRLRHLPDRVRELLDARQHGHQRPLGQRAVADLAALGRADATGLTGRIRREVVVVHVALGWSPVPASRSAGPS